MWTAKIIYKGFEAGKVVLHVEYTDGANTFSEKLESRNPDGEWIERTVKEKLVQLEGTKLFFDGVVVGATPGEPAAAAVDAEKETYLSNLRKLKQLRVASKIGIISPTDVQISNLVDWLKINYKPEYLSILFE